MTKLLAFLSLRNLCQIENRIWSLVGHIDNRSNDQRLTGWLITDVETIKYWEIDKDNWKEAILAVAEKVSFMPRTYYERAEDWMITCPICHGKGTRGEGESRKLCPKCGGAGNLSSTPETRKLVKDST